MNSWEIIKNSLNYDSGTVGRMEQIITAAKLYQTLRCNLSDIDISDKSFHEDEEVKYVLSGFIEKMKENGLI